MHTQTENTPNKKMISSSIELEKSEIPQKNILSLSATNTTVLQEGIKDKNYEMNDHKKSQNQNHVKDYQYISPRRMNYNNSYNKFSRQNSNRQNRSRNIQQFVNSSKQQRLDIDTNNNHQQLVKHKGNSTNITTTTSMQKLMPKSDEHNNSDVTSIATSNHNRRYVQKNQRPIIKEGQNMSLNCDQSLRTDEKSSDKSNLKDGEVISVIPSSLSHETASRKYSIDFLHQVGHQYKISANQHAMKSQQNQSSLDDTNLLAVKKALDNSSYYNHLYTGALYGNQLFLQHSQYQANFTRTQQQQQQTHHHHNHNHHVQNQTRVRMFHRQEQRNYQKVIQQNSSNRLYSSNEIDQLIDQQQQQQQSHYNQQSQQQANVHDQRSYHNNSYYQTQQQQQPQQQQQQQQQNDNIVFSHHNRTKLHNRDQNNRKPRNHMFMNNGSSNNNNNNSNNNNVNSNNRSYKKSSNDKLYNLTQTKSDNSIQHDDSYKRKNYMYIQTNTEEYKHRSLSSTPPSSVKSISPGIRDQTIEFINKNVENNELTDDSESTASASSSALSCSSDTKILSSSQSSFTHVDVDTKENNISSWVNNNNNFLVPHSGLSLSAEQLNVKSMVNAMKITNPPPILPKYHYHSVSKHHQPDFPTYDPAYPFDYYNTLSDQFEMRVEPASLTCGSKYDKVSQQIWEKFQVFQQTRETYQSKMNIWRDLYEYIKSFPFLHQRACPKWGIFLVGSTISGFGLDSSDIDMCLVLKTAPQLDARTEAMITLSALKNYLTNSSSPFQGFSLINAKVPILRFRDLTNTIEVDLNYNNCIGVRNTHLLHCYAQLDWRLRPLAIAVKLWAQYHNINDARNSTISSYSLVLMVIHFLQSAVTPSILPCLHKLFPEKFQTFHDITTIDMMEHLNTDWRSDNTKTIGELFLLFLDYYSNFNYAHNAISIRTGGVLTIEECRSVRTPKNDPAHWQTLCIEEPFDLTNTARSTYDGEIFEKIKNVFFQSWHRLKETKNLDSLFQDPLFVQISSLQQTQGQVNTQMLNDIKYMLYTPTPAYTTQQIISPTAINSEIIS